LWSALASGDVRRFDAGGRRLGTGTIVVGEVAAAMGAAVKVGRAKGVVARGVLGPHAAATAISTVTNRSASRLASTGLPIRR
jgi:hypothetical protein